MTSTSTSTRSGDWRTRVRESRFGTVIVLAVTAALVAAGAYLVDRPKASAGDGTTPITLETKGLGPAPKVGKPAQDFVAMSVDNKAVTLSAYRGHPVWLTFGASWCATCQAEAPDIEAAYQRHKAQGLVLIEVFINEESGTVRDYVKRLGLSSVAIADPTTRLASAYRVLGIPVHFFIDANGVLRTMRTGGLSPDRMDSALDTITRTP